ncbi:tRNA lysidine(34) synthetase TilS [Salipaludibacillus keqinensis]|uniref:tRNA(Ile)-lysidine synthase n=1 Tax=Salipaludibacillus keqinensis TaxID=2045207 RepID=A0A323TAF1_9BACI|nr:tRNA lysidine(34) synthetase TilS [Salipaludibacillus keqinensis]PYZ91564.1 tRNA lysidine(34) synthetase TilS [Salipaludibacillus keqinensis]
MKQVIDAFLDKHDLIQEGDHLLLAVSGGVDSMAMLKFFQQKQQESNFTLTVAHVDHGLRGEESKQDAQFVRSYCEEIELPFYLHEPDVIHRQKQDQLTTQEAARLCRYEWFATLMKTLKANKLVLAHHGDDQIETMLMRQIRGSLSGRKGMPIKRPFAGGYIVRPFLCIEKKDLLRFCQEYGVPFREDPSNESDHYQRNRVRHELLPFIKHENPKAHEIFQWQSEVWSEEEQWMQTEAETWLSRLMEGRKLGEISINARLFREIPNALQRRTIHLILNYLSKKKMRMDRHHIASIQELLTKNHASALLHLPDGLTVEKSYDKLFFLTRASQKENQLDTIAEQQLDIPSKVDLPLGTLSVVEAAYNQREGNKWSVSIDIDQVKLPFVVRSRRPGDRMSYLGGDGTKKIKNVFIDHKVPKRDRDLWPIVTDSHGTILWVPFLTRSKVATVTETSTRVVQMTYDIYT